MTALPVSGWILKAGMALSLCIKPYLTFPFAPSSASTACTCNTKVPVGWFSSTEACSRYCWHWDEERGEKKKERERERETYTQEMNLVYDTMSSEYENTGIKEDKLIMWKVSVHTQGGGTEHETQYGSYRYNRPHLWKWKHLSRFLLKSQQWTALS